MIHLFGLVSYTSSYRTHSSELYINLPVERVTLNSYLDSPNARVYEILNNMLGDHILSMTLDDIELLPWKTNISNDNYCPRPGTPTSGRSRYLHFFGGGGMEIHESDEQVGLAPFESTPRALSVADTEI